jgi:LPS sulfotransferase NodH
MSGESSENGLAPRPESIYDAFVNASRRGGTFDPSRSALFGRIGFVVGAPRSGTTWLQQLLLVHPHVATGGESHLFCDAVPAMFSNFNHPDGMSHLHTWVSEAELLAAARAFCDGVFEAQRGGTRPDARMVIEKTPNHRQHAALQARVFPDGKYVHIVRDGRDVTASQRTLWGHRDKDFADARQTAAAWADAIRDIRAHLGGLAYLEVRYEDLSQDTPGTLAVIFEHLGLVHDAALCDAAAAFGRAPVNTSPTSPEVGRRKHRDDELANRAVARAAGDLLAELDYADRSEIDRLRRARPVATARAELRHATRAAPRRLLSAATAARARRASRAAEAQRRPGLELARVFAAALPAADRAAITGVLAPHVVLQGTDGARGIDAVSHALVARFGSWRTKQYRVAGGVVLVTLVSDQGERALLRVHEENGLAASIDVL